jgi:hypothetical protein
MHIAMLTDNDSTETALHVVRREIIAEDPEAVYSYVEDDGRLYHAVACLMEGKSVCVRPLRDDWADFSDAETPFLWVGNATLQGLAGGIGWQARR